MADYSEILDDELIPDSPGTSILFFRLRDNPEAIALGAQGAPHLIAGWWPFDEVAVGDSVTGGLVYDHTVDGNTNTIILPDFEAGFDYRIVFDRVGHNSGESIPINLSFFGQTAGTWGTAIAVATGASIARWQVVVDIGEPMAVKLGCAAVGFGASAGTGNDVSAGMSPVGGVHRYTTAQSRLRGRLTTAAPANIVAGRIHLLRRTCYAMGGVR